MENAGEYRREFTSVMENKAVILSGKKPDGKTKFFSGHLNLYFPLVLRLQRTAYKVRAAKNFFLKLFAFIFFSTSPLIAQEMSEQWPNRLLFIPDAPDTERLRSSHVEFWGEGRAISWANAQGFSLTPDSPVAGSQNRIAAVFHSPGIEFDLYTVRDLRGELSQTGWTLVLDFASPIPVERRQELSSDYSRWDNILRYEIFVDGVLLDTVEAGYGVSFPSPVHIPIPFIRDPEGRVHVRIALSHHPSQFAILYDATLVKEN